MKRLLTILTLVGALCTATGCGIFSHEPTAEEKAEAKKNMKEIKAALKSADFTIYVDYMSPIGYGSTTLTDLNRIIVKGGEIRSELPYVGRVWGIVPYGGGKGLDFTSTIDSYSYNRVDSETYEVKISTRTEEDSYDYNITISDNGTPRIYVSAVQRDGINFDGNFRFKRDNNTEEADNAENSVEQ
mgnify:CR=1 FL=1